tara:strand:- start:2669 stop:3109 length:441 start_codon:yes stop_codon:yes gene_type:complete
VENIGIAIDRKYRILDHGGPDTKVDIQSVSVGFGTFSLLDMTNPVIDTSLPMALSVAATSGNPATTIDPNRPLVQLGLAAQYIDPDRVVAATGADLAVGAAPSGGTDDFNFLVTADATTATRLFGNGARIRLRYLRGYRVKRVSVP